MGVTRLAIKHPVAVVMAMLAAIVLGLISYFKLPVELNPPVSFPTVTISTTYTGTDPLEMETLITKPIEDSIAGVSGLEQINSTSQTGVSSIRCQFYLGTDVNVAASDITEKVDAVRAALPIAAQAPSVNKLDTTQQAVIRVVMTSKTETPKQLRDLADNIVTERLEQAPDVSEVLVTGGDEREIHVDCDPNKLSAYGITVTQLASAISQANSNLSLGYIQTGPQYASLRFIGEFATVDELKNLSLSFPAGGSASSGASSGATAETAGQAGTPGASTATATTSTSGSGNQIIVSLGDIATVTDTYQERTQLSTLNGQDAVILTCQKTSDGNTLTAVSGVKDEMQQVKKFIPKDVQFTVAVDQSVDVHNNINDVLTSLFLGAMLAMLLVFIFLHNIRATTIVAIAIPTCVIATFLPLAALGMTLNTMSLLGLSLAIGVLIDDSIVVIENIVRHLQMGKEPKEAALAGRSEIGTAAITLTMVDLVVFVPIAMMGGITGQFFQSFGVTVVISVLCSLFVSFTATPMLASRWFKKGETLESTGEGQKGFFGAFDRGYHRFQGGYRTVLRSCIRHPWPITIIGNVALILAVVIVAPRLGFTFAPSQDQSLVQITVTAPQGASLAYVKGITDEIERRIHRDKDLSTNVKYLLTEDGVSAAGGSASGNTGTNYAVIQASLYDRAAPIDKISFWEHQHLRQISDDDVAKMMRKVLANIAGAQIQAAPVTGFGGGGAPLEVDVTGQDFNQIIAAAQAVQKMFGTVPGVYNTQLSYQPAQPELDVRLDRVRAAYYGLNVGQVQQAASDAIEGNVNSEYRDPSTGNQYYIRVELAPQFRQSTYTAGDTPISYQNGLPITLGEVANITQSAGPNNVTRLNRLRDVAVTGYFLPGTQIGNVKRAVQPKLDQLFGPKGFNTVTYLWGGQAQNLQQETPFMFQALILGVLLSYMLMASLFDNVLYPLSIMLTMPQALVGALIALYISGEPLSIVSGIGIVMLNGIATKNAILMVDYTDTLRERGYIREDALMEAAPTRLRPILMTSFAVLGATTPIALALGRGAGFRQPLGIAVVGGVLVSTILSLLVVPCTYILFDNLSQWLGRRFAGNRDQYEPPTQGDNKMGDPSRPVPATVEGGE